VKKLKMGMVGGGAGAFIGTVHRRAAIMDGEIEFVAGALSSSKEKALASGWDLALPDDRNYGSGRRCSRRSSRYPKRSASTS
jgi:predicted dehydrogenase